MRDMAQANRLTRGYAPQLAFLVRIIERCGVGHQPLRVLDLGCGHAEFLRVLLRWSKSHSIPLTLTGLDLHPYAQRLTLEENRRQQIATGSILWQQADLLHDDTEADVLFCSLVAHHLPEEQVLLLLQRCATAKQGWMIADLRRSERAARLFDLMARLLRWHRFVRYDGAVSFRRAFSIEEWRTLVARAGVDAEVVDAGWGRILIQSRRESAPRL